MISLLKRGIKGHMDKELVSELIRTKEGLRKIGQSLLGKRIKDLIGDVPDEALINKGSLGQIIEEYCFGQKPHNDSKPDFIEAGVELKVVPLRKNKNNSIVAKERIVLNQINYDNENTEAFEESSFWKKNKNLYILFYEHLKNVDKREFIIHKELMLELSREDQIQIKEDWKIIAEKIKRGHAHEISESDTLYLGACTKGLNNRDTITQFNGIEAMKRAYAYKTTFVNEMLRRNKMNYFSLTNKTNTPLQDLIITKTNNYIGFTKSKLRTILGVASSAKNENELLMSAMIGFKGKKISNSIEFKKANIKVKTLVLSEKNNLKESVPLVKLSFKKLVTEEWDDSDLRDFFLQTKFVFCVFKGNKDPVFKGLFFWNMSESLLDTKVKFVWEKTKKVLLDGNILKFKDGKFNNFPNQSLNSLIHVRPRAKNKLDKDELPIKDIKSDLSKYTKQAFWLNSSFVKDLVIENFKKNL